MYGKKHRGETEPEENAKNLCKIFDVRKNVVKELELHIKRNNIWWFNEILTQTVDVIDSEHLHEENSQEHTHPCDFANGQTKPVMHIISINHQKQTTNLKWKPQRRLSTQRSKRVTNV